MRLRRPEVRGRNPNEGSAMWEARHEGRNVDSRHEPVLRDRPRIASPVMPMEQPSRDLTGKRGTDEIANRRQVSVVRVDLQAAEGEQGRYREQRDTTSPP